MFIKLNKISYLRKESPISRQLMIYNFNYLFNVNLDNKQISVSCPRRLLHRKSTTGVPSVNKRLSEPKVEKCSNFLYEIFGGFFDMFMTVDHERKD